MRMCVGGYVWSAAACVFPVALLISTFLNARVCHSHLACACVALHISWCSEGAIQAVLIASLTPLWVLSAHWWQELRVPHSCMSVLRSCLG
jgi:hypothetical protein